VRFRSIGLAALFAFSSCAAFATPEPFPGATGPDPQAAFGERLQASLVQLGQRTCEVATWRNLLSDPAFPAAPSRLRSLVYYGAAVCIRGPEGHQWIRQATDQTDAPPFTWALRFADDVDRKDKEDGLHALEVSAAQSNWTEVRTFSDQALFRFWRDLRSDPTDNRRLLGLLDRAGWKPQSLGGDGSALWSEWALILLEDGKTTDAARVAKRITRPDVLFRLRLDKRFDPITTSDVKAFDVDGAAVAVLEGHRAAYAAHPEDDELAYEIIQDLRLLNRLDEALSVADKTLAKSEVKDDRGQDYRNWIEDRRAMVLGDLDRVEEALAIEQRAAERSEHGSPNVSQRINLAGLLSSVGKHEEALGMLAPFEKGLSASPYGNMWVAAERACAAGALGRSAIATKALAFTAAHAADNKGARLKAQLCANDLSGARATVMGWLASPTERQYALVQLSRFAATPLPPFQAELARRFEIVRSDPAVVAAVDKVGRTETSKLNGSIWIDFL